MLVFPSIFRQKPDWATMALSVSLLAVPATYLFVRRRRRRGQMKRSMSFTSIGMLKGCFPPQVNSPDTIINTALYFEDSCPTRDEVANLVVTPLLAYERMATIPDPPHSRPSNAPYGPHDLIRQFDVSGSVEEVNKLILEHLQDPLHQNRNDLPYWEIVIIKNNSKGPSCALVRIHHALGDGLSYVNAFDKILTRSSVEKVEPAVAAGLMKRSRKTASPLEVVNATWHVLTLARSKFDDDIAFSRHNNANLTYSGKRDILILPTVPLSFVKRIKHAAGVSVNDVIMTAVSQAIRDYCVKQNDEVLERRGGKVQCRALLPASLPRDTDELTDPKRALRNRWCMVSADLAVGVEALSDRLEKIHNTMEFIKSSPRAAIQMGVQNKVAPLLPLAVGRQTTFDTFARHTVVLTNVPGPDQVCCFAGHEVKSIQVYFNNIITQIDILSYAGTIYGNIVYDSEAIPKLDVFSSLYSKALADMGSIYDIKVPDGLLQQKMPM